MIYDEPNDAMQTIFFGGMARYTLDTLGNLMDDTNVPFVKTISKVVRLSDSTMAETKAENPYLSVQDLETCVGSFEAHCYTAAEIANVPAV